MVYGHDHGLRGPQGQMFFFGRRLEALARVEEDAGLELLRGRDGCRRWGIAAVVGQRNERRIPENVYRREERNDPGMIQIQSGGLKRVR